MRPFKTTCIACWNTEGAFDKPEGIIFHSYRPSGVRKAVLTSRSRAPWGLVASESRAVMGFRRDTKTFAEQTYVKDVRGDSYLRVPACTTSHASARGGGAAEVRLRAFACIARVCGRRDVPNPVFLSRVGFLSSDVSSSLSQSRSRGLNTREYATWFGVGCLTHVGA